MSISAKLIAESYKGFKVKAVTKDYDDTIVVYDDKPSFVKGEWRCNPEYVHAQSLGKLEITEFIGKEAKDCIYVVEETPDYEKWFGKLCWFSDTKFVDGNTHIGVLRMYEPDSDFPFIEKQDTGFSWVFCRPVRRDEVQFVED